VSLTTDDTVQRAAYWPVAIVRAVPTAALALVVTFSADHSAGFGLLAFGWYGIAAGVVLAAAAWLRLAGSRVRPYFLTQAVVTLLAGIAALLVDTLPHSALPAGAAQVDGSGLRFLFLIVTIFAAVTGFLELYSGLRSRRRFVASGDWITVGALTVLVAVVFVLIPPGYTQRFTGPDHVARVLDASVVAVGVLGAWAAIVTVFLVIAGLSAKWGTQTVAPVAVPESTAATAAPQTPSSTAESENRA
jgi:hypothetical protein